MEDSSSDSLQMFRGEESPQTSMIERGGVSLSICRNWVFKVGGGQSMSLCCRGDKMGLLLVSYVMLKETKERDPMGQCAFF